MSARVSPDRHAGGRRAVRSVALLASLAVGTVPASGPMLVALAGVALATVGCATAPQGASEMRTPTSLNGEWAIASLRVGNETSSIPSGTRSRVFVRFTTDPSGTGRTEVNGFAGVNRFFGTATTDDTDALRIEGLGSTRVSDAPSLMSFENRLLAALRGVERWRPEGNGVILTGPDVQLWLVPDAVQ